MVLSMDLPIDAAIDSIISELNALRSKTESLKALHRKMLYNDNSGYGCISCSENWPCRTITILTDVLT